MNFTSYISSNRKRAEEKGGDSQSCIILGLKAVVLESHRKVHFPLELLRPFTVTVIYRCNIIENTQFVSRAQTYRLVQSILTAKGQYRNIWEILLVCEYLLQLVQLMLDSEQRLNCPSSTSTVFTTICYFSLAEKTLDISYLSSWPELGF